MFWVRKPNEMYRAREVDTENNFRRYYSPKQADVVKVFDYHSDTDLQYAIESNRYEYWEFHSVVPMCGERGTYMIIYTAMA